MLREVKTKYGTVRGLPAADPRITSFKGIPFAKAPVGENRWKAPMECEPWEGVRNCFEFGPLSVQDRPGLGTDVYCKEWHVDSGVKISEDNLYLNIWTPCKKADEKLPVLVWIFGGGFQWGYTSEMEFDGERLARRGIIVVSINYRLNVFGFLSHPEITKENPEAPANFGLLDQHAGLKWVSENIEYFGGDPNNITLAGQSAGGGSVMHQITSEKNKGLVHKAVIMSAMISSPYEKGGISFPMNLAEGEKWGEEFFAFMGVKTLKEARTLDADYILQKYNEFVAKDHMRLFTILDGKFCKESPTTALLNGNCLDIPIMSGNTTDEFLNFIPAFDDEDLCKKIENLYGEDAKKLLSFPRVHENKGKVQNYLFGQQADENMFMFSEVNGIELTIKTVFEARKALGSKNNYYYYCFDPDIPGPDNPGTFHSVDLWFFFETLAKCWRPFVGRHYDLSRQMCNYWANFIKTGNPNGKDADGSNMPEWEAYEKDKKMGMYFRGNGAVSATEEDSEFKSILKKHMPLN